MRTIPLLLALVAGLSGTTFAAGLHEAPLISGAPDWPNTPAADALARALAITHCGEAPPTRQSRVLWRAAGPGVAPIPLCRCLRAAAILHDPERFIALGAEAVRRGTPAWHTALGSAIDTLPETTAQACIAQQRR